DSVWQLRELPRNLLILGGGPVSCELAQAFQRLGAQVTLLVRGELLPREDRDIAEFVREQFERDGIRVLCDHRAVRIETRRHATLLMAEHADTVIELPFDRLLIATGRKANTENFG